MSNALLSQLSGLERALALRPLSPEQRRRLQPIVARLCLRLARSIGRPGT